MQRALTPRQIPRQQWIPAMPWNSATKVWIERERERERHGRMAMKLLVAVVASVKGLPVSSE